VDRGGVTVPSDHESHLARQVARLGPGVHRWTGPELGGTIAAALAAQGRRAVTVVAPSTKAGVIAALADAYRFPAGTGRNWDALADLLADHAGGTVLVLDGRALATASAAKASDDWDVLLAILRDTAAWFASSEAPFAAIVLGVPGDQDSEGHG
jgi:hypothetical protein